MSPSQGRWQMCGDRKPFHSPAGGERAAPGTSLPVLSPAALGPRMMCPGLFQTLVLSPSHTADLVARLGPTARQGSHKLEMEHSLFN